MIEIAPCTLEAFGVRLEPLADSHAAEIRAAVADGESWNLFYTSVPSPSEVENYIHAALEAQHAGDQLPWAVRDLASGVVIGSTRYHDVVPQIGRVEIGYTWYAASHRRTHVNTDCKQLLLGHAFDSLGCRVVGLRTDGMNMRSQRAIEALGAHRDGRIRHHAVRKDGTPRDTVFYSILTAEWQDVRRHLELRRLRHESAQETGSIG